MTEYKRGKRGQFVLGTQAGIPFAKHIIQGDFTPKSTFEWVPTDRLLVDVLYQRNLEKSRVSVMANNWNQSLAGVIMVNLRDNGNYYVMDGQHRHAALQLMENTPEKVWCEVFRGLTPEQEAKHFADQEKRRNLTTGARFKARVASKDITALEIVEAVTDAGLTVNYMAGPIPGNLRAYGTLTEIHRRRGKHGLARILKTVAGAWPHSEYQGSRPILNGLETFFAKYGDKVNDERLISTLSLTEPHIIVAQAHSITATLSSQISPAITSIIRSLYNKSLRKNRLPE